MRHALDTLYRGTLWLSAFCLCAIALMVGAQLVTRLIDGALALAHLPRTDIVILSLNEICGYLLAAASFLALAGTLKAGAHIRVTMLLSALSEPARRYVEIWAFGFSAAACGYGTYQLASFTWVSLRFHEVSPGVVRVPLVYPQAAMAFGALILTIALVDELVIVVRGGRPTFRAAEDAITLGKEG
ncbi:MAG: TRAP transporter small permease subunit [Pseudolabrys sp.]|jgi:TRAP-type C4-dicarboxylate transport system permease small subunit